MLAEGMSSADFLHGPIAVMAHAFPALSISTAAPPRRAWPSSSATSLRRAGPLHPPGAGPGAELPIPAGIPEALAPIVSVVRAQQLARETAIARGLDPDAPPGLSKVTMTR